MFGLVSKKKYDDLNRLYYKYYNRCNKAIEDLNEALNNNSKVVGKGKIEKVLKRLKGEK